MFCLQVIAHSGIDLTIYEKKKLKLYVNMSQVFVFGKSKSEVIDMKCL